MKRFALLVILTILSAGVCKANDIYLAQNATGSADGSSCGSAKAISFFNSSGNWGTGSSQIGPGDTVHLCGTITGSAGSTALTFQGSGNSSSPITVLFESGAGLTAPYWSAQGGINTNGQNYLTIDGGSNGYMTASANGSGKTYQQDTKGIFIGGCTGCVVKNLTISNMFVHTSGTTGGNSTSIYLTGGKNNTVTGNTIHDARWCVFYVYPAGSSATSDTAITNNTIYNCDHGISAGDGNGGAKLTNFTISGNVIHDMVNWDEPTDSFHHDYIHVWAVGGGSVITGLQIFNNYFYGDPGQNHTALINVETQSGNTNDGAMLYNNVLTNSSSAHIPPYGYISSGGTNISLYNNTIVGSSTSQGAANECFYLGGTNYKIVNNTCQNVGLFLYLPPKGSVAVANNNNWYQGGGYFAGGTVLNLSAWKTLCQCDANSTTSNPNLDSSFKPQSNSSILKAGANLSSLGVSALNKDKAQNQRASSGAWDVGAFTLSAGTTSSAPNPPTALSASVQ